MSFDSMLIHSCTIVHKSVDQELRYDNKTEDFVLLDTITGQLSGATGIIENITGDSNGVLVLNSTSGTFQDNETITGTIQGSASANGVNYDHLNEYGAPELTKANVTTSCRFHSATGDIINKGTGDVFKSLPTVTLPADIDPLVAERIIGLSEGFTHTYEVQNPQAVYGKSGIHHWTCELEVVE